MDNRNRQSNILLGVLAVACFVAAPVASDASAADLVVRGGQLVGATDVNVSGTLYDVALLDGSCFDLFNPCIITNFDFAFSTSAQALAASQALLDQVLIDGAEGIFDTFPRLTNGCEGGVTNDCDVVTPYGFFGPLFPTVVNVALAINGFAAADSTALDIQLNSGPLAGGALSVWAVWTPVPGSGVNAEWTVRGGQLVGALDVNVGGTLYDVAFLDGTCLELFDGCDSPTDFTFLSQPDAEAAAQALLNQVFINTPLNFDSDPELTNGCEDLSGCFAGTPYAVVPGNFVFLIDAFNDNLALDGIQPPFALSPTADITADADATWAIWTPVPEPGSTAMLAAGSVALAALVHRRDRLRTRGSVTASGKPARDR